MFKLFESSSTEGSSVQQLSEEELKQLKERLLERGFDSDIFSLKSNADIRKLIRFKPRDFAMHLFMFSESIDTLNYWFDNVGAPLPSDAIALAVRLRCSKCVFEYLDKEGLLRNIDMKDKEILLRHAEHLLGKAGKQDALDFFRQCLNTQTQKLVS